MNGVRAWLMARGMNALLRWRSRASLVRSALGRLSLPRARPIAGDQLQIGVAQTRLELAEDGASFAERIGRLVAQAVTQGAQLVVFPEDVGFSLLGLLPGARAAAQATNLEAAVRSAAGAGVSVADLLQAIAPGAWPIYRETFAGLARRTGAFILGGSLVLPDEAGRLYNVAFLFGPDGEIRAQQRKTHLFHIEKKWGLETGDEIAVCELPNTRIAFPICMDHTFFEPIRVAYLRGAEVIIDPSANPERYDEPSEGRGVWSRVQESPAYGVLACMVGTLAGTVFEGRSQVLAPLALTPRGDGILAQAKTVDQEEVVVAEVDLAALRAYKAAYGPRWNLALYRRYLPQVYGEGRRTKDEGQGTEGEHGRGRQAMQPRSWPFWRAWRVLREPHASDCQIVSSLVYSLPDPGEFWSRAFKRTTSCGLDRLKPLLFGVDKPVAKVQSLHEREGA